MRKAEESDVPEGTFLKLYIRIWKSSLCSAQEYAKKFVDIAYILGHIWASSVPHWYVEIYVWEYIPQL